MPRCLTRLELQGYKTFVSKTDFEFGDVTCIVGPNGSGKSNIADGLRWVLGEQSYQLLRGRKTEDMIFSGSEKRPKASMAAVTVVFDNSDGWLPIDFSEVSLTRRAYRDGHNEYLLNGNKARLRDIADLLGKVGLGRRTYTIIGQGLVDTALSLKADERRALFEEAAGIGTYRQKREESLRKLEETQRNLERIQDIVAEIQPRLRALARQAKRAGEHRNTLDHFRGKLRIWYGYRWHHVHDLAGRAKAETEARAASLAELRGQQTTKDEYLAELRADLDANRIKLNSKRGEHAGQINELEGVRRQLAVAEERARNLVQHQQATSSQFDQFELVMADQSQRLEMARGQVSRLENEHRDLQHQLTTALDDVKQGDVERRAVADRMAGFRKQADDIALEITEKRARKMALEDRLQQLVEEGTGLGQALLAGRDAVDELRHTIARRIGLESDHGTLSETYDDDHGARSASRNGLSGDLAKLVGRVSDALAEVERLTSKHSRGVESELTEIISDLSVLEVQRGEADDKAGIEGEQLEALTLDDLANRIAGLRTSVAVASRAFKDHSVRCGELSDAFDRDKRLVTTRQKQSDSLANDLDILGQDIQELSQREAVLESKCASIQEYVDPLEAKTASIEVRIREREGEEASSRVELHDAERSCAQAEIMHERTQSQLATLRQQLDDDLNLIGEELDALDEPHDSSQRDDWTAQLDRLEELPDGLQEEIVRLRVRMRRMGGLNSEAVAEYEEVKKRYEHLQEQVEDLEKASEHLREVIAELDALMHRDFHQTFEAVAKEFQHTFGRLFGGGSAHLELTSPDDLSSTGIEIVAQLPGRREQGLALLSGGERSLTACALVFALLRISPTPFAMLDEVDAMLDEANVGRFREILAEISQTTQFVVITHNRHTVEAADTVYGVSMGTDSASQVISLKLN